MTENTTETPTPYLLLKTYANCDMEDAAIAECALVAVSHEALDYWLGMMDQAAQISAKLDKTVTLSWPDWTPDFYPSLPAEGDPGMPADWCEDELDPGYCLLTAHPWGINDEDEPDDEEPEEDLLPAWDKPFHLSYCELRVDGDSLQWFCGPKYGSVEEYTAALTRDELTALAAELRGTPAA